MQLPRYDGIPALFEIAPDTNDNVGILYILAILETYFGVLQH
jgi:hypothetical protein